MAYGRVEETFWRDPVIRSLSCDARVFMLYILTCPHKNRLGLFVLDPYYAAADLKWDPGRAEEAIEELEEADRILFDESSGVLFVKRFLKHNTIENTNVVKGAVRELAEVPDTRLFHNLLGALNEWSRPHYVALLESVRNRLPNDSPNDSGNDCSRAITRSRSSTVTKNQEVEARDQATSARPRETPTDPDPHGPEPPPQTPTEAMEAVLAEHLSTVPDGLARRKLEAQARLVLQGEDPKAWEVSQTGDKVPEDERPELFRMALGYHRDGTQSAFRSSVRYVVKLYQEDDGSPRPNGKGGASNADARLARIYEQLKNTDLEVSFQ